MRNLSQMAAALLLLALPALYTFYVWDQLPAEVPLHFGADGQPDRFGPKSEIWVGLSILMGAGLFSWLVITNLDKIDPKKAASRSPETMQKMAFSMVLLISIIGVYIVRSAITGHTGNFLFVVMGLFFSYLGNLMHSVKSNYFVGFRLPWTLENEENWRKTHQLASKMWVVGGLLIAAGAMVLSPKMALFAMLGIVAVMAIIPTVYSYRMYKEHRVAG